MCIIRFKNPMDFESIQQFLGFYVRTELFFEKYGEVLEVRVPQQTITGLATEVLRDYEHVIEEIKEEG